MFPTTIRSRNLPGGLAGRRDVGGGGEGKREEEEEERVMEGRRGGRVKLGRENG